MQVDVETYHRLGESGVISERTELIRGVIVVQTPKSPLHSSIVETLGDYLAPQVAPGWIVRREQPLTLALSEPEPDLAVVPGIRADYLSSHPSTASLVVEVCITTEDLDRVKLGLYAEAGVAEVWLVLAEKGCCERHTDPVERGYRQIFRTALTEPAASTVFPSIEFPPEGFLRV